ncbi:MAG: response regulator [Noviherbaspirillum sp.]
MKSNAIPGMAKPTIMIVDDTPANVGLLVDSLEERDFRIVVAQDGDEALRRAQFVQPDLILLDVMMPGIDGFETCRRLKAVESLRDVPVIFMTALTYTSDKVTAFSVGGVDYVAKPFQIEEVLARINTHLALRLTQKQLSEQNLQLQKEMAVREQTEMELRASYEQLKVSNGRLEEMHQQLVQAEKMASVGLLAAGVAHEINNPIAFVNSNLGMLREYLAGLLELIAVYERGEPLLERDSALLREIHSSKEKFDLEFVRNDLEGLLAESLDGVQRVRRIVQDLKDFSHVGKSERQVASVQAGIDSTLNIISNEIKHKVQVRKEYGDIPDIACVPAQLNQVFLNLLMNAVQAIEHHGLITIRSGCDADWVWVEVTDNGCGIAPENLARIFEPFFTTKPAGRGTGLGLSLSYGIVGRHGGRIDVNSVQGAGSTFRVWLPNRQT